MQRGKFAKRDHVDLADGTRLPLAALPARVPHLCFQNETHMRVCRRLAGPRATDDDQGRVYVNFLFTKSMRAKQVTALLSLVQGGRLAVRTVRSRLITSDWTDEIPKTVAIETLGGKPGPLINRTQYLRFAIKAVLNRVYRLLSRPGAVGPSGVGPDAVRAWTGTAERTFGERFDTDTLLIYPFLPNLVRQWRFLRRCRQRGYRHVLMGIPYRLTDAFGMLLGGANREARLVRAEVDAYRAHAAELLDLGVRTLRTTDESDMAGCVMHADMMNAGATCINRMHGIGVYGPYVTYSTCSFYTGHQQRLYTRHGRIGAEGFHRPERVRRASAARRNRFDPLIVVVQGNWRQVGKRYEAALELEVMHAIRGASQRLRVPAVVKLHPNTFGITRWRLSRRVKLPMTYTIEGLGERHPIFVNLLSTAYYTFLDFGPSVFVADALIDPRAIFGDQVICAEPARLESALVAFADPKHWHDVHDTQIASEARVAALALPSGGAHPAPDSHRGEGND